MSMSMFCIEAPGKGDDYWNGNENPINGLRYFRLDFAKSIYVSLRCSSVQQLGTKHVIEKIIIRSSVARAFKKKKTNTSVDWAIK